MKSRATLWLGAGCALVLAAASLHWMPHRRTTAGAELPVPIATPPGITLQMRTVTGRSPRAVGGQVLFADAKGMTLYVYDKDLRNGGSSCGGDCIVAWPPAIAPPNATRDGDWSLLSRVDGTRQRAYRGAPLYRFARDKVVGVADGDGADGGAWHAAAFQPGAGMAVPDAVQVAEIANAGGAGLADSLGMTLYAYRDDAGHPELPCAGGFDCGRPWIPLEAPQIANPVGDFSVIARDTGITQWTYRGRPLYRFDGDQRPGEANGIGVDARFQVALIVRYFMPADATIRRHAELGDILTTASGATLYERDLGATDESLGFRENHGWPALGRSFGTATCDENCAKSWPPFTAPADALPRGYWDIAIRPDGTRQWMYKGYALYTRAAEAPAQVSGNQLYDLGAVTEEEPAASLASDGRHTAPGAGATARAPAFVPAGGDVAGIGVRAMFWHAVVP
jgi:predicted lipoprotein with Yx(FWY)xxD motif